MPGKLNRNLISDNTRAIVLDWDDTVMGSMLAKTEQHIYVAREHFGIELTPEYMIQDWGRSLQFLIEKWYRLPAGDQAAYEATFAQIISYSAAFPKIPLEGAFEAIKEIKQAGYPIGVVTGSPSEDIQHDFLNTGTSTEWFDYFQMSGDSEHHKPDPRVFDPTKQWLDNIGVDPSETLFIGDTLNDYWAARDAGMMFLGVESAAVQMPEFYSAGAVSIRSLGDLLKRSK